MHKTILPIFWILAIAGVVLLANSFNEKSEHFFGITDNREQNISFQYPVEIIQAFALEGEDVQQGRTILEVRRHDLLSGQDILEQQIRRLELEKNEAQNTINSKIESLSAKRQTILADIDYQIHVTESRLALNRKYLQEISGIDPASIPDTPEAAAIADLKKKRAFSAKSIQAEIDNLRKQLHAANRPVDAKISELQKNKSELQRQSASLKVKAQFNGRIGSVNYKAGDLVAAFQPIMTVHRAKAHAVKGYIHENILNEVKIGQTVWVKPLTRNQDAPPIPGIVESLGNRIVEYPERLKKDPQVGAFGREVVVHLRGENSLLLGEKVDVLLEIKPPPIQWSKLFTKVHAESRMSETPDAMQPLLSNNAALDPNAIEASGVLWNAKEQHYLLVSDEQYNNQPGIFILDKNAVLIERLDLSSEVDIDDLESISSDGQYIYTGSSLSRNKAGTLKPKRRKLLRFRYRQQRVTTRQEIDLYTVLENIVSMQPASFVAEFLSRAMGEHRLEIEAQFVKDNALFLGFKAPLLDSRAAVIIKVHDVEAIFAGRTPRAELWQTLALTNPETGEPTQLADMLLLDEQLILLSSGRATLKQSYVWQYDLKERRLKTLRQINDAIAEGVAYRPDLASLLLVFDNGKHGPSSYQLVALPPDAQ